MRILLINYEYPPVGGGGGNASEHIARRLVDAGCSVCVVTGALRGLPKREVREGVEIVRIPSGRRHAERCSVFEMLFFLISSLIFVPWIARQFRPNCVLAFFGIPCGPSALLLRCLMGVPYVIALRGGDVPGFLPEQLAGFHRLTNWLSRLIWRSAARLTANSAGLAALAQRFDARNDVVVIPNGVDRTFFLERTLRSMGPLTVLFVGRLTLQKRVDRLISVFVRLQGKSNLVLRIVGDGPERAALEMMARKAGLSEHQVDFLGWCDHQRLTKAYQDADVFALASDYEGMPNVVLEAMAGSLAVVATKSAGTVDLVKHSETGYLVDADRLQEFEDHLLRLDADRELLFRMQNAARVRAAHHTWDDVAKAYRKLCHDATMR